MRLPFTVVDAFASHPFTGNQAAVMPLDAWLPDATLQSIAAEHNYAETAYLVPTTGDADYELRWFTPAVEVALCGHATLASGHHLLSADPSLDGVRLRTRKAGVLEVSRAERGYAMRLPAYPPAPRQMPDTLAALGVGEAVATLWHPSHYALIVLANEDAVRALTPDYRALARLTADDAPNAEPDTLVIATAPGRDTDVVSRVFAAAAGIDEDPVTGSAHAVLTPFWAERLGRAEFTAYQASQRGGHVGCRHDRDHVVLTGQCITTMEGVLHLPE